MHYLKDMAKNIKIGFKGEDNNDLEELVRSRKTKKEGWSDDSDIELEVEGESQ